MTGIYLRVYRKNKWRNVEIEYLTDEEIENIFNKKTKHELIEWVKSLRFFIKEAEAINFRSGI